MPFGRRLEQFQSAPGDRSPGDLEYHGMDALPHLFQSAPGDRSPGDHTRPTLLLRPDPSFNPRPVIAHRATVPAEAGNHHLSLFQSAPGDRSPGDRRRCREARPGHVFQSAPGDRSPGDTKYELVCGERRWRFQSAPGDRSPGDIADAADILGMSPFQSAPGDRSPGDLLADDEVLLAFDVSIRAR